MPDVKLAGQLPGSSERNGITQAAAALLKAPLERRIALIVYDAPTHTGNAELGTDTPKIRVVWIEDQGAIDANGQLMELMNRSAEARTGEVPLPFDATAEPADNDGKPKVL